MPTHERFTPRYRLLRLEELPDGYVVFHFDGLTEIYDPETAQQAMREIVELGAEDLTD